MDSIRDLAAWYPFIPSRETLPDAACRIVDMKVCAELPPADLQGMMEMSGNGNCFSAQLTRIGTASATVLFYCPLLPSGYSMIQVPVFTGSYSMPGIPGSYIIVSEPVEFMGSLDIHPDCIFVTQRVPEIRFMHRGLVSKSDSATVDGMLDESYREGTGPGEMNFSDGHNVRVSYNGGTLTFNGSRGGGKGLYTEPPYAETDTHFHTAPDKGMRSINGVEGSVAVQGNTSVTVSTGMGAEDEITLTVTPRR